MHPPHPPITDTTFEENYMTCPNCGAEGGLSETTSGTLVCAFCGWEGG